MTGAALSLDGASLAPSRVRAVHVENVTRAFGRFTALDDVSVSFLAGQVSAVVGPNGAGKTTLLTLLATLGRPDEAHHHRQRARPRAGPHVRPHIGGRARRHVAAI